jgi:Zn-dependent peptidase ImmA (M78 family)
MNGIDLAQKVIAQYGTTNIFEWAAKANVVICYERWYPISYGEFDKKSKKIYINLNAPIPIEAILLHELGHFFIHQAGIQTSRLTEEKIVQAFVETVDSHGRLVL